MYTGSRNNVFDIDTIFDGRTLTTLCTFLKFKEVTGIRSCMISFGSVGNSRRCNNLSYSITNSEFGNSGSLQISTDVSQLLMKPVSEVTCIVVTVSDDGETAGTERKLSVNSGHRVNSLH